MKKEKAYMTTSDSEHNNLLDIMEQYLDDQKPQVGIFWYDYENDELFGVESCDADSVKLSNGIGTIGKLHQNFWKKQHLRAIAKNDIESPFFNDTDYTMIPRGRIFVDNGIFKVFVGSWINGEINGVKCVDSKKLRNLIVSEFNIPSDFEFIIDSHWELGNGWSEHDFNCCRT